MANPSRYRYIKFYGGRILQAREVSELQRIQEGLDSSGTNRVVYDLDGIYREGATMNINAVASGGSVTLTAGPADSNMYVFIRGRWEVLQSGEINSPLTLSSSGNSNIYLNWVLRQVTSSEDTTLVDTATGEPTADMGELDLTVSLTDNSGLALNFNQIEKNINPIILFTFNSSGTLLPIDNVKTQAYGNATVSGFVKLTTNTAAGVAASTDDPRMTDARNVLSNAVVNSSVRTPQQTTITNNADGTPEYDLTFDPGGISSAKIVHIPGRQLVSDAIQWIKSQITTVVTELNNHIGVRLGLSTTHPMPTAADVGATPLSHVGLPLGLATSHPATVNTNSGGYVLNRDSSVAGVINDPAYGIFNSGTNVASLNHDGDVYSAKANTVTASPLSPATTTGALGLISTMAHVIAEHVNQTSHNNPHGLSLTDLGGVPMSDFTSSIGISGFITLPGGLIIQWLQGTSLSPSQSGQVYSSNFVEPFPNSCLWVGISAYAQPNDLNEQICFAISAYSTFGVSYFYARNADHGYDQTTPMILAIGF